ncbi:MAG TPA: isocitrate lyase/PEP mutase family protein [Xanthobacteraceae bacterium]|nr:isocitrate lyase/PEP mutase family protein [Xanthobacteraceae bacterium]
MSRASKLRALLRQDGMVVAPGAYDCITARTIAQAGFPAVYMTGAGTAATLGFPDYGLVTMSEMADNAGRIATAVDVPVIADADTGYGNELNTTRTVREYEKRGVAGLHIEDQGFPKKCGHLDNKVIVPLDEYLAKVRAAVAARSNPDFLIIARTDSRAVLGLEEAVRRANAALGAGADVAFVEAPQTMEEVAAVPKLVKGPCLFNNVWRGKSPDVAHDEAQRLGYKITIVPGMLFKAVLGTCDALLKQMKEEKRHPVLDTGMTVRDAFRRVGADEWDAVSARFHAPEPAAKPAVAAE